MKNLFLTGGDYQKFRKELQSFVGRNIKPYASEWEQSGKFPDELLKKCAKKGFLGLSLPVSVGGQNKDFWHEVIMAEELAKGGTLGWVLSVLVQTNVAAPLLHGLGTMKQHKDILKPALNGDTWLALGLTETVSGSHLAAIKTKATAKNDHFVVEGEKSYISNGSIAGHIIILARKVEQGRKPGIGLLVIPAGTKGVISKKLQTSGFRTGDTASITFKDYKVSKDCLLGNSSESYLYLLQVLQRERLISAVALNSVSKHVIEQTIEFLKVRERFGEPLSKKQIIRHRLVELLTKVESSRQFTYSVCQAFGQGKIVNNEIVMLKILAFETSKEVIRECIQLHGAVGFLETHWLQHIYRDSQAFTIAGGTSEIMRELLATNLID